MSSRNPKTGRRSKAKPGDRLIYTLPPGPPAAAIELYGGDVQAAVTAGLTLLAIMTATAPGTPLLALPTPTPNANSQSHTQPASAPDPLASVMTQPLFGT